MPPFSRIQGLEQLDFIDKLAKQYEPQIQAAVENMLFGYAGKIDEAKLIDALQSGNVWAVMDVVNEVVLANPASLGIEPILATTAGAAQAAKLTTMLPSAQFVFGQASPLVVNWAANYSYELIKEVNQNTIKAIQAVVTNGLKQGIGPITQARDIREVIGLTDKQAQAVLNFRKQLETIHQARSANALGLGKKIDRVNGRQVFRYGENGKPKDGILSRRLRDFRFDSQIKAALDSRKPLTPAQIDKMVAGYARKYLKYRAQNIARTESIRATSQGIQKAYEEAANAQKVNRLKLRRFWLVAKDERSCPTCSAIPNMNKDGVGLDEPFKTPIGPVFIGPLHPSCRCGLFIMEII